MSDAPKPDGWQHERGLGLLDVARALGGSLDLDTFLHEIVKRVSVLLAADRVGVAVAERPGTESVLRFVAQRGMSDAFAERFRPRDARDGATPRAIAERRAVWSADVLRDPEYDPNPDMRAAIEAEGFRAVLSAPLLSGGRALGALVVFRDTPGPFSRAEVEILEGLAAHAAIAIEREELNRVNEELRAEIDERQRVLRELEAVRGELETDLQARTKELQIERDRLQNYLDIARVLLVALDAEGRVTLINRMGRELLGRPEEDIVGRNWFDLALPEEQRSELKRRLAQIKAGEVALREQNENAIVAGDGRIREVEWRNIALLDESGEFLGTLSSGTDITERRRAEEALRESEARFRTIFEAVPFPLFIVRRQDGAYLYANEPLVQVVGVRDDIGTRTAVELYWDSSDRAGLLEALEKHGRRIGFEIRHRTVDGKMFWGLTSSVALEFQGQDAILTTFIDITERKEAEEVLARSHEELEGLAARRTRELERAQRELSRQERLAAIGQLIATVSHELRNPLGTISATFYSMRAHIPDEDGRLRRGVERIDRNIARCTEIIEDLLDYTRVREPNFRALTLDEWLAALVSEQLLPSVVELTLDLRSGVTVQADPERLRQAVVNLIDNACQIMASRGDESARARIAISSAARNGRAEIRVTDTGPGIPAALRDRIFEPLFSTRSFGFGLGLPRVKQIMEQHGGGVDVESASGGGTTMRLWLPLHEERRAHRTSSPRDL